jgi:hypothetical protein
MLPADGSSCFEAAATATAAQPRIIQQAQLTVDVQVAMAPVEVLIQSLVSGFHSCPLAGHPVENSARITAGMSGAHLPRLASTLLGFV